MGSRLYIDGSFKLLRKSYLNRENYIIPIFKRNNMSGSMDSCFNTILGTSIKAANHAGKMVRDIMKTGDLSIVEKTGADDLQTAADRAANDIILGSLKRAIPKLEVIGEEGIASANIEPTWLIEKSSEHELKDSLPESLLNANLDE